MGLLAGVVFAGFGFAGVVLAGVGLTGVVLTGVTAVCVVAAGVAAAGGVVVAVVTALPVGICPLFKISTTLSLLISYSIAFLFGGIGPAGAVICLPLIVI